MALRRDRNYIYFPDAITACLRIFANGRFRNLQAECYKTSDRHILARELSEPNSKNLFGHLFWEDSSGRRSIALYETEQPNLERYDLLEPRFEFEVSNQEMRAVIPSSLFPSPFHRWAALCKKLYYSIEKEGERRLLLQRITLGPAPLETSEITERIRLDFKTKDHFMKFSVWQSMRLVGEVVVAACVFGRQQ